MILRSLAFCALTALPLAAADNAPSNAQTTWESHPFTLVPRGLSRDPHLDVIVYTEMSKDGLALPAPSAAHPTYIAVLDSGEKTEGDPVAGEKRPNAEALKTSMLKALAVNGYLLFDKDHPPTQLVNFIWGSFNKLEVTGEGDDLENQNLAERASLVGGLRFGGEFMKAYLRGGEIWRAFKHRDAHTEWLCDQAEGDLYFIMATSYDYKAATQGVKKALWQTKMSTDSQGITMDESVPTLVVNSGAFFGKPTNGAARLNRPTIKDGQVQIGTAVEVDSEPGTSSTPAPARK